MPAASTRALIGRTSRPSALSSWIPMKADLSFSYFGVFIIISYDGTSRLLVNDKELRTLGHFMLRFLTPLLIY